MTVRFVGRLAVNLFLLSSGKLFAQNCVPTNLNGSVITRPCAAACSNLVVQVPDIRTTTDYVLSAIPYNPYEYVTTTGTQDFSLYNDDQYSALFPLPFEFCFFGTSYTSAVVGSNGLVTFDPANQSCANNYVISTGIPYNGGVPCASATMYAPRASIMAAYSDLDPSVSLPGRKIQWEVIGRSPCRKFVVSYYHIGVYGAGCALPANTFQIVMHESTGIIEFFYERKSCASSTNSGRGIFGIQNWNQNVAVTDPAKNNQFWTENNSGYRFTPAGGGSLFQSCELLTLAHTPVATGTASTTSPGFLSINFNNICVTQPSTRYVVRTTYTACENPASTLVSLDTITLNIGPMAYNPTVSATSCNGASDGSVTLTPDGIAPLTYRLDGGAPVVAGTSYTFPNLNAGPHTIEVVDVNGCTAPPVNFTVNAGPPLTTTATKTDVPCNGGSTGTITVVQPAAGAPPYQYSLDNTNWQTSPVFNNLPVGVYTVYFRELNGCNGTTTVTINEPPVLEATSGSTDVICNGQSNGTITVTANGGVGPYEYSLNGINWQTSNVFNVPAGNYTVTIRDVNGCTTTTTRNIGEPPVLSATSSNSNASCDGGNDGVITVAATGGNSTYQYSIDGVNFQSSNIFNVAPGNYNITVRDNLGCTTSFPTTVGLDNNLTFTAQTDPTICEGTSTQLQLVSNGTIYAWTPATGLSAADIPNPVANPTVTTQYIVTTTLGRCSANDTVIVNVNAAPIPNAGADGFICFGQTYQLQASGGTQYSWSPTTYLDNPLSANPISSAPKDITYTVTILSDANGCASLTTDEMRLDVTPPIKVTTFPFDTVAYDGDKFQILAVPSDPDVINYSWTPTTGLSDPNIANPIVTTGAIGDVVQYQVTTSTVAGCKGFGYVTVKVYKGPDIYVPTGFTPNGDGKNDRFTPYPVGIKTLRFFRVYNRWGQLVFSTTRLHEGWDGKINGVVQQTGTFVWMVEVVTDQDKVITKKGTVTLIR